MANVHQTTWYERRCALCTPNPVKGREIHRARGTRACQDYEYRRPDLFPKALPTENTGRNDLRLQREARQRLEHTLIKDLFDEIPISDCVFRYEIQGTNRTVPSICKGPLRFLGNTQIRINSNTGHTIVMNDDGDPLVYEPYEWELELLNKKKSSIIPRKLNPRALDFRELCGDVSQSSDDDRSSSDESLDTSEASTSETRSS